MVPSVRHRLTGAGPKAVFFGLLLVLLYLVFVRASAPAPAPSQDPRVSTTFEVRFTRPDLADGSLRGGPDADLANAIEGAQVGVEMAIYNLDLWSVRDALLAAHRRGVPVRLVVERDHLDQPEMAALIAAGIPVAADTGEPLMHDKFTVIDGSEVWTGSMNYTISDGYRNDNNLVTIRSEVVAQAYQREFAEMFVDGLFGALSPPGQGVRLPLDSGGDLEVYFAPDDRPLGRLVDLIAEAESGIDFLAFAFTSSDLAGAMLERAENGVRVRGVIEEEQAENLGSQWPVFREAGLDVRLDGNPRNMHHKVVVIDRRLVIFGSYNLSRSAESFNDENLVVVDQAELAERFLEEFERVFDRAR